MKDDKDNGDQMIVVGIFILNLLVLHITMEFRNLYARENGS
jgi:hypothetical protein